MGQLILYNAEGVEVGRRAMDPSERYVYYRACASHDLIAHAGMQYRVLTVAWKVPQEELTLQVVCEGPVPVVYVDD